MRDLYQSRAKFSMRKFNPSFTTYWVAEIHQDVRQRLQWSTISENI